MHRIREIDAGNKALAAMAAKSAGKKKKKKVKKYRKRSIKDYDIEE